METIRTPNNIEVLVHYHCVCSPHPRADAPAVKEATEQFLEEGLIEVDGIMENRYTTTLKGRFMMEMLCNTPFPVLKFCDPREK